MLNRFLNIDPNNIKLFLFTGPIKFLSSLGLIIFNIFMINFIEKEDLGNFLLCLSLIVLLSIFSKAGLSYVVLRIMSVLYYNQDKHKFFSHVKQILLVSSLISFIIIFFTIIFEDFIALNIYNNPNIRGLLTILVLSLPFYTFVQIQKSIFKSFKIPYLAPLADIGMILILVIIFTFCSNLFGFGINVYRLAFLFLIINIILFAFFNLLIFYLFINKFQNYNTNELNEEKILPKSLLDFLIIDFINYVFVWGSIFICSFFLSANNLADFSSIYWLAFAPLFIPIVLNSIYGPIFAVKYNSNKLIEFKISFNECKKIGIIICTPIAIILFFFSNFILKYFFNIYGNEYNHCFKILILAALVRVIFGPVQNSLNMSGQENYVKKITLFISLTQIIAMFITINFYGIISLAYIYLVFNVLKFYLLHRNLKKLFI